MKIKQIILFSLFAGISASSAAETLNYGKVTVGENIEVKSYDFLAIQGGKIQSIRTTPNVKLEVLEGGKVALGITPTQNTEFRGAAFAVITDDSGNRFSVPVLVAADAHYSEAYDEISFNKYGDELITALRGYLNGIHHTYNYNDSRDIMYGYVDNYDGIVECPYTGNTIETTKRPDGTANFDTEHTWPQAFGAGDEPQKTNMHHMRPSWKAANNKRGNSSFGDVVSNVTYEEGGSRYGKNANGTWVFEVRDEYKGDIARGVFYFALHYGNLPNNNNADDLFLDQTQYEALKAWSLGDAPSERELERNARIKERQGSHNPFIEHPAIHDRMNLIGEYTRTNSVTCGDSLLEFAEAGPLPLNFFSSENAEIEYIRFDSLTTNFDYSTDFTSVTGGEIHTVYVSHSADTTSSDQTGIIRVKLVGSDEFKVYLKAQRLCAAPDAKQLASVYPNPTTDFATITLKSEGQIPEIQFYNEAGVQLFPKYTVSIDGENTVITADLRQMHAGQVYFKTKQAHGSVTINK